MESQKVVERLAPSPIPVVTVQQSAMATAVILEVVTVEGHRHRFELDNRYADLLNENEDDPYGYSVAVDDLEGDVEDLETELGELRDSIREKAEVLADLADLDGIPVLAWRLKELHAALLELAEKPG